MLEQKNPIEVIENNFKYHSPTEAQEQKYQILRQAYKDLALLINELCPHSRERSVAFTELETSAFWANASIARNE
jgi:hypothetical protein